MANLNDRKFLGKQQPGTLKKSQSTLAFDQKSPKKKAPTHDPEDEAITNGKDHSSDVEMKDDENVKLDQSDSDASGKRKHSRHSVEDEEEDDSDDQPVIKRKRTSGPDKSKKSSPQANEKSKRDLKKLPVKTKPKEPAPTPPEDDESASELEEVDSASEGVKPKGQQEAGCQSTSQSHKHSQRPTS